MIKELEKFIKNASQQPKKKDYKVKVGEIPKTVQKITIVKDSK